MARRPKNRPDEEWITTVRPQDVLFGRGSGPNDHEGNVRFRAMVAERKGEYMATTHRQTKAKVAREIADVVWNEGGRFLKRVDGGVDAWCVVDEATVLEKAKQALRQNRGENAASAPSPVASPPAEPPPPPQATVTPEPSGDFTVGGRVPAGGQGAELPHPENVPSMEQVQPGPSSIPTGYPSTGTAHHPLPVDPFEPIPVDQIAQPQRMPSGLEVWADFAAPTMSASGGSQTPPKGGVVKQASDERRESLQISDLMRTDPLQRTSLLEEDLSKQTPENSAVMDDLVDGVLRMSTQTMDDDVLVAGGDSGSTMGSFRMFDHHRPSIATRGQSASTASTKNSNMSGISIDGSGSSLFSNTKPMADSSSSSEKATTVAATAGSSTRYGGEAVPHKSVGHGSGVSLTLSEAMRSDSLQRPLAPNPSIQEEEENEEIVPRRISQIKNDPDTMDFLGSSSMAVIQTAMKSGDSTFDFSTGQLSDLLDDGHGDTGESSGG